ncbi:Hypothetical predicted protein [Paramuricea clavata]|uniref:Uncharacterized protein n=1 Tax=Paramuricea clavata TaxID=317549 RepID=A0A7D9KC00_PARCT|nr:Hypothetical predicted protein [Paramuricea clavata]
MSTNIYTKEELGYFRLAKGVINHSTAALRKVFKQEWNYLYPLTPWRNDGTSGSQMLAKEQPSSRLYDPKFAKDYQAIKDHLRHGDMERWDVTTLVFALLYSYALSGIRNDSRHWRRVKNAIHEIKGIRNTVLSHACKASIAHSTFMRIFGILERAVEDLLTTSDPLVGKLKALRTETEFVTDDLVKYKKLLQEDHNSLLLLDKHLERLECKMNISIPKSEARNKHARSSAATSKNSEIISNFCRRVDRLERELPSPVDSVPGPFRPTIFHRARYIRLMNKSSFMASNFRWEELGNFLQGFNDSVDMQICAGIQSALALSHRSRKDECFEVLNRLIPKALLAKQYG